jgi:hypothetical protein
MIPRVDSELSDWVERVLPGTTVRHGEPSIPPDSPCVNLYLYRLASAPALQQTRGASPAVTLRYLVTVHDNDSEQAHRVLGTLLFEAMQHPHYVVDLDAATEDFWQAFGLAPRPAFVLTAPLRLEQVHETPRVRDYPRISTVPAIPFRGVLLGPGDIPLADARVVLVDLDRHTRTDREGRFVFAAVPPEPSRKRLRIAARGLTTEVHAEPDQAAAGQPVTIRLTQLET